MKRILSLLTFTLVLIIFLSSCKQLDKIINGGNNGNPEQIETGSGQESTKDYEDKSGGGNTKGSNNLKDKNNRDESDQEGDESGQKRVELDQEGVEVQVIVPLHVEQGGQFEITLKVTNNTSKEQKLKEIKIDQEYLDAVAIIRTEPNYKNVSDSLFSDQKVYEFQSPIGSHEKTEFTFYAEAIDQGEYRPNFDVDTTYELSSLHKEVSAFIDENLAEIN